ncbi:MAG: hypothetical protein IJA10_10150 [Lachnospiraceae bacterium]|nr:hypothetical protein [Lachnospiraceae bacterium]
MGIGNRLVFDVNNNVEDFTFILSTRDYRHLGQIRNIDTETVRYEANLNSANKITFQVYKSVIENEKKINEPLWTDIADLKLVYVKELDEYFEITVSLDDSNENVTKTVTGTSLCEAELSQCYIHGLEVNTEVDIGRPDYVVTKFYNFENHDASFLHRVLSYAPHYELKHVDSSLINIQRSFSVDGTSVYDFLTGECAEQFKCIFVFDTKTRGIYVYDLYSNCEDCGYRSDICDFSSNDSNDFICPECSSKNIKYFGQDTTIYVDKENLTDSINFTTDIGSVKNCLKMVAGDDIMTSTIRLLNMNGTDNIVYVSNEQKKDMPVELVEKLDTYDELYLSYKDRYETIVNDIYESIDKINYYTHSMMPTIEQFEVTVQTEANKLTSANLSPLGLSSVTASTSISTVESALKNYAKIYIKTGYVKLEVNNSTYNYIGEDKNGNHQGAWTGNFKVINNSDKEDVAYSKTIRVIVHDDYQSFIEQKIMKGISNNAEEEYSVFDVLSIEDLDDFEEALTYYSLNRLTSFYDAIQVAMDTLIELNQANTNAEFYDVLYLPYYKKLQVCQSEIDKRQAAIDEWQQIYDNAVSEQQEIQSILNFKNYLGEDLYKIFCAYKREDTYQNSNFISDGLSDAEIIEHAKEFIELAKKELIKSASYKHSISSTLHNLLVMPEFKPIINMFELGNWIRIRVDGDIYRLRLIGYTLSFSSIQSLEVEFSDVSKVKDVSSDIDDILESAQSMSTNFSYVSMQATKGSVAKEEINNWVQNGLKSSLVQISNNNSEEVGIDNQGIFCRSYDDISDSYSQEQLRITHNVLVFTENNWASASLGLGKHEYVYYDGEKFTTSIGYGLSSKFSQNSYVYGSQIIGGDIYSENYSKTTGTYINLKDGTFSFGGGALTFDGEMIKISSPDLDEHVTTITKDTVTTEFVNALNVKAGSVDAENITGDVILGKTIEAGKIIGSTISNGDGTFYVDEKGSVQASDINITGGTIGEFKLYYSTVSGSYYLETLPTETMPLTTGIGNNEKWAFWTGYDYGTDTATFWVTNNGEVHMKNWLYGAGHDTWALWTRTDNVNRYGIEYIYGDWDFYNDVMNVKFVFYDHYTKQKFYFNLPISNRIEGTP